MTILQSLEEGGDKKYLKQCTVYSMGMDSLACAKNSYLFPYVQIFWDHKACKLVQDNGVFTLTDLSPILLRFLWGYP